MPISKTWPPMLAPGTMVLALLVAPSASAQSTCEWYARTAVRQQQINEEKKCGLAGEGWHKDLAAHTKWCGSVAPELWKAEAQKRNQLLEACEKR